MAGTTAVSQTDSDQDRWRVLVLVCLGVVLCMTTWFSATAITPALVKLWGMSSSQTSWLTNAVQLGFVFGALASSLVSLPDLVPLRRLMAVSAVVAAVANLSLLWVPSVFWLMVARFITGIALAGIYPSVMKLIATWFVRDRGTALGLAIAALTLGSAFPHLLRVLTERIEWQAVVFIASAATFAGGLLMLICAKDGPFPFSRATFNPAQVLLVFRNKPLVYANLGYFGHMWELYAMWGWFLSFTHAAMPHLGLSSSSSVSLIAFIVIASGAVGCVLGGISADRFGRTLTAAVMMGLSGLCAASIGFAFDGPIWLFLAIGILWGITVIADSAQFSAMATELSDPGYVGTVLALQLGLGFILTIGSIRLTPVIAGTIGWHWSFLILVPGPVIGIAAMLLLRKLPDSLRIAHGRR